MAYGKMSWMAMPETQKSNFVLKGVAGTLLSQSRFESRSKALKFFLKMLFEKEKINFLKTTN